MGFLKKIKDTAEKGVEKGGDLGKKGIENYNLITHSYNIYEDYDSIPIDQHGRLCINQTAPLYPDDIMIHTLTQQSCISIITLGILEDNGYSVVRELVGHGIGENLHEEPQVPNFGSPSQGYKLHAGMCIAIEPMINLGSKEIYTAKDGWTILTVDGKASAHFEHTIAIMEDGPRVLSRTS